MAQPSLFREELRRAWRELRGAQMSPARTALAVAIGLFIGSQPIFGLHTPIVLGLCIWWQLDAALAWVASNISNPFFAWALITAEVQVGAYLRRGAFIYLPDTFRQMSLWEFALTHAGYAFLGAPFVGAAIALVGAGSVYVGVRVKRRFAPAEPRQPYRLPADAPPWWHATERVAARYAPPTELSSAAQRTQFHYVRVKLLSDPVTQLIAASCGEDDGALGDVLDLGTGRGQLPVVLLELGRARSAHGVDWDEEKIAVATRAAGPHGDEPALAATFEVGDLTRVPLPPQGTERDIFDTVLLIDVIHYLPLPEQDELLRRAAAVVAPGGRLLVREADTARGWRSWLTLLEEKVFTTLRFNRGARVRFRSAASIVEVLEGCGLSCEVRPAWGSTPFSNVLFVAERPS